MRRLRLAGVLLVCVGGVVSGCRSVRSEAVRRRVAFLRDGLDHLVLNREAVALGMRVRTEPELRPAYEAAMRALLERRRELSLRHVIWGDVANQVDRRRGSPSLDGSVVLGDRDLDGI